MNRERTDRFIYFKNKTNSIEFLYASDSIEESDILLMYVTDLNSLKTNIESILSKCYRTGAYENNAEKIINAIHELYPELAI